MTGVSTFVDPVAAPAATAATATKGLAVPGAQPYPWPFDGAVTPERTAVVAVAAQAGLAATCAGGREALKAIAELCAEAKRWGATIVATRHGPSPANRRPGIFGRPGEASWELAAGAEADEVVDAFGIDGFSASRLAQVLHGRGTDHLLLCGLGMEGPVHSTLRSANDRGLECLLVRDACAPFDAALAGPGVRMIEMSGGIFGAVADRAEVLAVLRTSQRLFPPRTIER